MTSFATAADLGIYLKGDAAQSAPWLAQASLLLELISADIQAAAGQLIEAGEGTHLLAGTWDRDLELPQRPALSVSAVSVNGSALDSAAYTWNSRQLVRRGGAAFTEQSIDYPGDWAELGMQGAGWISGGHWGGPDSTISVTYAWGRVEVPGFVRSLALRVAGRTIENPSSVSSEQLGAYSVQYGKASAEGASHLNAAEITMLRKRLGRTGGTIAPVGIG